MSFDISLSHATSSRCCASYHSLITVAIWSLLVRFWVVSSSSFSSFILLLLKDVYLDLVSLSLVVELIISLASSQPYIRGNYRCVE